MSGCTLNFKIMYLTQNATKTARKSCVYFSHIHCNAILAAQ